MYKTIVVHIDGSRQQDSRVRAAAKLADSQGAHVIGSAVTGISWLDYALLAAPVGGSMLEADYQAMREAARAHLDAFARETARLGVASCETRLIEEDARYALLLQSRYADLLVLSQRSDAEPAPPVRVRGLPGQLMLEGVRPVLVVPDDDRDAPLPDTAIVAWDGSMRAVRAINAALPLLQRATAVKLALINPDTLGDLHGDEPGADMALYLARQGVSVDVLVERTRAGIGQALLDLSRDLDAGLIVAGAFGHNRYREWVLGGVTRTLLEEAQVPVLFAH